MLLEHLSEWQSIVDLTQPRYLQIIDEAIRTGDKPNELKALRTLVRENYGLPLYEEVERAKVRLSDARATTLGMDVPGIRFSDTLERWDFERLIGPVFLRVFITGTPVDDAFIGDTVRAALGPDR